jgi:hypothetical protein
MKKIIKILLMMKIKQFNFKDKNALLYQILIIIYALIIIVN